MTPSSISESYGRVLELLARCGETDLACEILEQSYLLTWREFGTARLLQTAIEAAGAGSQWTERLGFHYGLALYHDLGEAQAAEEVFHRALEYARRSGERVKQSWTLTNWSHVLLDEMKCERANAMAEQAVEMAAAESELWAEATGRWQRTFGLLGLGRVREAGRSAVDQARLAERLRSRFWLHSASYVACLVKRQLGDLPAARESFRKADTGWQTQHSTRWGAFLRLLLELEQGNPRAARALRSRMIKPADTARAAAARESGAGGATWKKVIPNPSPCSPPLCWFWQARSMSRPRLRKPAPPAAYGLTRPTISRRSPRCSCGPKRGCSRAGMKASTPGARDPADA